MAKLSAKYEAMVVFSIKNGEDNVKALVEVQVAYRKQRDS